MSSRGVPSLVALTTVLTVAMTRRCTRMRRAARRSRRARARVRARSCRCSKSAIPSCGSAGNWLLAEYQFDELKEDFDDVRTLFPSHDGVHLTPLLGVIEQAAMPDFAKAIEAKGAAKFAAAFDALTAACNGRHQSAEHGFTVIQRPTRLPYSDQSFAPAPH